MSALYLQMYCYQSRLGLRAVHVTFCMNEVQDFVLLLRAHVASVNKFVPVLCRDPGQQQTRVTFVFSVDGDLSTSRPVSYESHVTHLSTFDLIKQPGAGMKAETGHYLTPLATGTA